MTLPARIREHAATQPAAAAVAWRDTVLDYAALADALGAAETFLRALDARVIALDVANSPAWVLLDIAAQATDVVLVPLPPFFSAAQIDHLLAASGADCLVGDRHSRWLASGEGRAAARLGHLALAGCRVEALRIARGTGSRGRSAVPPGVCKVTFTSGTTGTPKGVMLGWRHLRPVVTALADATAMGPGDRHLCQLPLAVLLENLGGVYVPLWSGACCVLAPPGDSTAERRSAGGSSLPQVDGPAMLAALASARATTTILTPQSLGALLDGLVAGATLPTTLRFAAVGGAAVPVWLLRRARAAGVPVFEGYGLSECASVVCLNTPDANRPGSVGRPLSHVGLSIAPDGEILVDGEGFAGYLGEPPRPPRPWATGDLGYLDGDGYLYLRGRRRNVFITASGRNVSPEWVEGELAAEAAIAQAVVFGEARPFNTAVIVRSPGATGADVERAVARVNGALPDYARVGRWLPATEPFSPVNGLFTANGRPRRDAVWRAYAEQVDAVYREVKTP